MGEAGPGSRGLLGTRLRKRLPEPRAAVVRRVHAFDDPGAVPDPAYREGLDAALPAAAAYSLACLEGGDGRRPEVPVEVLAQAPLDARDRVPLDTAARRCSASTEDRWLEWMVFDPDAPKPPPKGIRRPRAAG